MTSSLRVAAATVFLNNNNNNKRSLNLELYAVF